MSSANYYCIFCRSPVEDPVRFEENIKLKGTPYTFYDVDYFLDQFIDYKKCVHSGIYLGPPGPECECRMVWVRCATCKERPLLLEKMKVHISKI